MQLRRKIGIAITCLAVLVVVSGTAAPSAGAKGEPLYARDRMFDRETDAAVTIRAARGSVPEEWGTGTCDRPGCMPKPCQVRAVGWLGLSTAAAVGESQFEIYPPTGAPTSFVASGTFGAVVDHPVGWVVLRTGPKTAEVEARFRYGGRDSMRPVDGWVILAAPLDDVPAVQVLPPSATITARDSDGAKLKTLSIDSDTPYPGPSAPCPTASLPARFPKPTGRVPADEDGARAAVTAAFEAAYGGAGQNAGVASVEDGMSLVEVVKVASDQYPQYAGKIHARVDEVRFIDGDEAAVRFGLDVTQDPAENLIGLPSGIGRAVFRSGAWLVSRSTFCALLAFGGVYCPLPE